MAVQLQKSSLLPLADAATWRGKRVGIYGGSFNPAHSGHLHVAIEAINRLKLDLVILMVSPGNPLKDGMTDMAAFDARMEAARQIADEHPKITVSDIETRLGTRFTAETIRHLKQLMPTTKFTWIMGADSMASFHHWYRWQDIVRSVPIAVFDRPGYALSGFAGRLAHRFRKFRVSPQQLNSTRLPAWTFVAIPRHSGSATMIRRQLGHDWPSDPQQKET